MATGVGAASKARAQSRRFTQNAQVPLILEVRLEGQAKRSVLAEALGARLLATLREHLSGCGASLCGDRSPDYFSKALRGERVLSVARDIAQLATRPEREARAAISDFALTLLDQVRPQDGTLPGEAVARLLHEATETISAYARAMDDGRLDVPECDRILSELNDLERATGCARAVVEGERRRKATA